MDMTNSTLFLKLVGSSRLLGDFEVFTSATWRGSGLGLQLQNAYMRTKYLTIGYAVGSFMDLAAVPVTIDYGGPCGMTFYRSTQVQFRYGFDFGLSMGIALEAPTVNATENENISMGAQRMPHIPVFVQYDFRNDPSNHIRLGGILRDISYTDKITGRDSDNMGWGAQASVLGTMGKFQLKGQFTIGEGIGSLVNNISNVGVDMVPDPQSPGKAMFLRSMAWYAGVQYNFTNDLFASATFSQTMLHSRSGYAEANPTAYRKGQYLAANVFYNITRNMQLGIEYLHGWRTDFDDETYNANRVNLSVRYDF
jgi:predicted porin